MQKQVIDVKLILFWTRIKKTLAEIKNISAKIADIKKEQDLESEELEQLYSEVFLLAEKAGISMPRFVEPTSVKTSLSKETSQIQANLKLHKMLFLSHTLAASGNAIKVFTYAGNPLSINLPQWLILLKESTIMIKAVTRDTTHEKLIRNRMKITKEWQEIQDIIIRRFD